MNPLIRGLFNRFKDAEELALSEADAFELFVASLVLGDDLLSQVEITDLLLDLDASSAERQELSRPALSTPVRLGNSDASREHNEHLRQVVGDSDIRRMHGS